MRRPALLLLVAAVALTLAAGAATGASTSSTHNGTTLTARIQGTTATNVSIPKDANLATVRSTLAGNLGVEEQAINIVSADRTVEIRASNVSTAALHDALAGTALDVSGATIRRSVTADTQAETVQILRDRLSKAGFDTTVRGTTADGVRGVRVRASNAPRPELVSNLSYQGRVAIVAHFPDNGSQRDVTLLTNDDFATVGSPQYRPRSGGYFVPVTLTDPAAENFSTAMRNFGFTGDAGIGNCSTQTAQQHPNDASGYCLYTRYDGHVVYAAQMSGGLATEFENGDFVEDPRFVITAANASRARDLALSLRAGAVPAPLAVTSVNASASASSNASANRSLQPAKTDDGNEVTATETASGAGPGFTAVGALAVLLALGVIATRTDRD